MKAAASRSVEGLVVREAAEFGIQTPFAIHLPGYGDSKGYGSPKAPSYGQLAVEMQNRALER